MAEANQQPPPTNDQQPPPGDARGPPPLEPSFLEPYVPFIWIGLFLALYCHTKNITFSSLLSSLFAKNSNKNTQNFEQQASESTLNSREERLRKIEERLNSTTAERKAQLEAERQEKLREKIIEKINKNEAILKGTTYSGPGQSTKATEEEEAKRKEIEELLKKKREQKKNQSSQGRSLRDDDFNPLGNNSSGARFRPTQPVRRSA